MSEKSYVSFRPFSKEDVSEVKEIMDEAFPGVYPDFLYDYLITGELYEQRVYTLVAEYHVR